MNATKSTEINFQTIQSVSEFDLKRHAVIEASAGTGKTYTLIELVMRLIIVERMGIEKLLLVTFTEQAAGEIKARIRQRLHEAQEQANKDKDESLIAHLENNVAQLNHASIFTIHGFCHGALKEFAFEQGAVFEAEKISDYDVRLKVLQQMKRSWPADKALISQLEKFCAGNKGLHQIDQLLLDLAGKYKPGFDALYPSAAGNGLSGLWEDFTAIEMPELTELEAEFEQLKGAKTETLKKRCSLHVAPFVDELQYIKKTGQVDDLLRFLSQLKHDKKFENNLEKAWFSGLPKVYDQNTKDNESSHNLTAAPQLFSLMSQMNQLLADYHTTTAAQQYQVIPRLLDELMTASAQYKRERGLISFDDMIIQLWQKLKLESKYSETSDNKEGNQDQLLTQALRNKYQVAIIDEFQDTDIRQWQIFEQLFLKSGSTDEQAHRLWVIGDPKQAIYGFRGADIHTYEAAKVSITDRYQGKAYRLNTNFRTTAELIAELNRFFADENSIANDSTAWFNAKAVHVKPPSSDIIDVSKVPQIVENNSNILPLNCLHLDNASADEMKKQLAEKIALTIKHQIIDQVRVQHKEQQRSLNAGDVCVLVRSHNDAVFLEEALQKQRIPFTIHKKKALFQSIEAKHFQVMLTALAYPSDIRRVNNALVSLFFNLQPNDLADFAAEQLPRFTELWLKVKEAVLAKQWIEVFELLLHDSGAMYRASDNSRRLANLKQLKNMLLKAALQNNYGAEALLKYFTQKREQSADDEDLHHKDTEQQAVKIMTMHISKGLEFPVVFLFSGFSQSKSESYLQFYDESQQGMVFDLVKEHQKIYHEQQLAHAKQLYYVAMTRAVFMLFLPHVDQSEKRISSPGPYTEAVMTRLEITGQNQQQPPEIHTENKQITQPNVMSSLPEFNLILPTDIQARRRNLHSFSSLSRFKSQHQTVISNDSDHSLTAELMQTESQPHHTHLNVADSVTQVLPQIPGGVKTGHVLHGIFEHVDFAQLAEYNSVRRVFQQNDIMQVVDDQMKQFKLENRELDYASIDLSGFSQPDLPKDYREQLAAWVWHTLNKPLDALDGGKLAQVSLNERSHELSFFWNQGSVYLTGFIDLFFAVPNQAAGDGMTDYYILDWKSNYSANGYSPEVLADEVMTHHKYNWQYQLYAMAMQQWFDALGLKNARLKGAIYLFSRGINCQETAQNGVFFDDFINNDWQIEAIRSELLHIDAGVKS